MSPFCNEYEYRNRHLLLHQCFQNFCRILRISWELWPKLRKIYYCKNFAKILCMFDVCVWKIIMEYWNNFVFTELGYFIQKLMKPNKNEALLYLLNWWQCQITKMLYKITKICNYYRVWETLCYAHICLCIKLESGKCKQILHFPLLN